MECSVLSLGRNRKNYYAARKKSCFQEGLDSAASSPRNDGGFWSKPTSFKDKLVSEIPGAFTQAFNFGNLMEDDANSDEEVEGLREGLVAVKFSKELKQRIRSPWYKALIVKVYGQPVRLKFSTK